MHRAHIFGFRRWSSGNRWFQRHSTFRTRPRLVLVYLGVHRADVLGHRGLGARSSGCTSTRSRSRVRMYGNSFADRRCGRSSRRDHGQHRSRRRWARLQVLFRRRFKFFCAACAAEKIALPAVLSFRTRRSRVHLHAADRISLHHFLFSHFLRSPNFPLAEHDYIANAHGYIDDAMMRDASYRCWHHPPATQIQRVAIIDP
jgi:hypothetical protein